MVVMMMMFMLMLLLMVITMVTTTMGGMTTKPTCLPVIHAVHPFRRYFGRLLGAKKVPGGPTSKCAALKAVAALVHVHNHNRNRCFAAGKGRARGLFKFSFEVRNRSSPRLHAQSLGLHPHPQRPILSLSMAVKDAHQVTRCRHLTMSAKHEYPIAFRFDPARVQVAGDDIGPGDPNRIRPRA
jgi:hypothetical protein